MLQTRLNHVFKPQREVRHAHYVSVEQYPLTVLPPFALGNFYVFSSDVAAYLARNADDLRPVGEGLSTKCLLTDINTIYRHS